jgi:VanZ family protein
MTHRPQALVWMIPAALLYGAGIEIIQPYVNRSRDLADFLADGVGILAGSALGLAIFWFRASAKASGTRS